MNQEIIDAAKNIQELFKDLNEQKLKESLIYIDKLCEEFPIHPNFIADWIVKYIIHR
jgi:hypothetical protein